MADMVASLQTTVIGITNFREEMMQLGKVFLKSIQGWLNNGKTLFK